MITATTALDQATSPHSQPATPLENALRAIEACRKGGQIGQALRLVDQAWRTMPEQRPALAPVYGRLLLAEGVQAFAAVGLLLRAVQDNPGPELEADLIRALLASGQPEAAQQRLATALQTYAVDADGSLETSARTLASALAQGWAGLNPALQLVAESPAAAGTRIRFEVRSGDGRRLAGASARANAGGCAAVRLELPAAALQQALVVTADGRELIGGRRTSLDFGLDGRADAARGAIDGWLRLRWHAQTRPGLIIRDSHGRSVRCRAGAATAGGRHAFHLALARSGLRGARFDISALLPDGREQLLPDAPLLLPAELRASLRALTPAPAARRRTVATAGLYIVVPVYKDLPRTAACLEALLATVAPGEARIVVVDDASPEAGLAAHLDALAGAGRIELLRNAANLGFSASVNRAMALYPDDDAVLVNSDVLVFPGWLGRLRAAAYGGPRIGTVTPFADDDSVAGYHTGSGDEPAAAAQELDRLAAQTLRGVTAPLPVGVGYCLYIRRDCWRDTGVFDARVFGRGYGEESDFCMRARGRRWRHLLAADVFVHHAGGSSFGSSRPALLERSQRLLNLRHPGYDAMVARWLRREPLLPLRRRLDEARLLAHAGRCVLILSAARGGGADRFVNERCRQIRAEGRIPLILCPPKFRPDNCLLQCTDLGLRQLRYRVPDELPLLRRLLRALAPGAVELHHFIGLDPRLVALALALRLGAPYDAYLHDYSWFCPRVTLIDASLSYCGEPPVAVCERCVARHGSALTESIKVRALRRRSAAWLGGARRVIAPSEDTAARFRRQLPGLAVEAVPHEVFLAAGRPPARPAGGVVRIALLGAIGTHKGYRVLLDCARDAFRRKLQLEFVVVGFTEDDVRAARDGIFVTGPYSDGDLGALLHREQPHAVFLASVWPETWSYALSHAIRSGLPIVAFDIGAIAERLRAEGAGTLLPLGLPPAQINDRLLQLCS